MRFKSVFSPAVAAAAFLCLPAVVQAQETHTITPHFPDNFKLRYVTSTDQVQESQGKTVTSHTTMTASAAITRHDGGYHGSYRIDSYDLSGDSPSGEGARQMLDAMRELTAEVTMDGNLDPVSVDNIDEIKAKMKSRLTASTDPNQVKGGEIVYNMLLANLTPESAAAFMRQSKQSANFFNVPLTVGQPVRVDTAPMEIMGASLRTNTNMTLTSWEEGKVAHLHYVMAPTDEDLHNFMATLLGSMFGSLLQGKEGAAEAKTILDRMIQNMEMTMSVACDVDFSLVNYVDTHQVCDTKTFVKMDMKKIMPPEMLKDNPAQAEQLPVITMTQTDHLTSDSNLVQ